MPVRLRYLEHDLQVPEGQFVIGRSSTCQLSIDDPMISRTHAMLVVSGESAIVDDLRSRNGVLVNGERVQGTRQLVDGDTLTVGGQKMTIHGLTSGAAPPKGPRKSSRSNQTLSTSSGIAMLDEPTESISLKIHSGDDDLTTSMRRPTPAARVPDRRVHELSLVGAVAEKAIAMGRPEEASRILERPLKDLLTRARSEEAGRAPATGETAAAAASLAVRLAVLLQKGDWIDYVFDLYSARAELLPQPLIDELYTILRKLRIDGRRVRVYLTVLRERPPESFGPTGRFLISRIEGLEPLVGLK